MEDGHIKSVDEIINYFGVDADKGLSPDQVKRNQEKYGLNGEYFFFMYFDLGVLDKFVNHAISGNPDCSVKIRLD